MFPLSSEVCRQAVHYFIITALVTLITSVERTQTMNVQHTNIKNVGGNWKQLIILEWPQHSMHNKI